jgi:hypothetical protein
MTETGDESNRSKAAIQRRQTATHCSGSLFEEGHSERQARLLGHGCRKASYPLFHHRAKGLYAGQVFAKVVEDVILSVARNLSANYLRETLAG